MQQSIDEICACGHRPLLHKLIDGEPIGKCMIQGCECTNGHSEIPVWRLVKYLSWYELRGPDDLVLIFPGSQTKKNFEMMQKVIDRFNELEKKS